MTASTGRNQASSREPGLIALALWFGIAGALAEISVHFLRRFARHRFMFLSDDIVWMGPVMTTGLLLLVGAVLWAVQWKRRRPAADAWIPAFLFLSLLGVCISYPRLHWSADAVLAAGVAFQLNRMIGRRRDAFGRLVVRTVPALVAVVVLLAGGLYGIRSWRAHRLAPGAARPGAPNVLLIILDTVRGIGLDGGDLVDSLTPRLAERSRSGVRFDRAFAASSWTLPSHGSVFTGQWPHDHHANWNSPLDSRYPTIAEAMSHAGYETAGFIANKEYVSRESGLARGFQSFEDYLICPGEFMRSSALLRLVGQNLQLRKVVGWYESLGRKDADEVNREALAWLDRKGGHPYFVFLNYFDAHTPYLPPPPYDSVLRAFPDSPGRDPERRFRSTWQENLPPTPTMREMKLAYGASVRFLDNRVDAFLDSLEARKLLSNTIVIIAGDHGEEFGEHDAMGHGHNVYRTTVQVPLIIWQPGITPRRITTPASLRDIPATIVAAAGVREAVFPGRNLLDSALVGDSVRSELIWVPGLPPDYGVGDADQVSWIADSIRIVERIGGTREEFPVYGDPLERGTVVK